MKSVKLRIVDKQELANLMYAAEPYFPALNFMSSTKKDDGTAMMYDTHSRCCRDQFLGEMFSHLSKRYEVLRLIEIEEITRSLPLPLGILT